jgi:integrase
VPVKIKLESKRLYSAEASPPHTDEEWTTTKPLTADELINELYAGGPHQTDIGDALYAADPEWESDHQKANHQYRRDRNIPEWHGWHAARRGLGRNLYRLGVPDLVIQRVLRHASVSSTATCYIKTVADDVRNAMVETLSEPRISNTQ